MQTLKQYFGGSYVNPNPSLLKGFVDVDTPPIGKTTGCKPRDDRMGDSAPIFEEHFRDQIIDDPNEWKRIIDSDDQDGTGLFVQIHDQDGEPSCTYNAGSAGIENQLYEQTGVKVFLAPISGYRFNGSPSSGSTVNGCIAWGRDVGFLPVDTPENRTLLKAMGLPENHCIKHNGYHQQTSCGWPDKNGPWRETAAHFRTMEVYDIESFAGMVTAVLKGWEVHYGRAGHSILGKWLMFQNGQPSLIYQNSWTPNWGKNGFGVDTKQFLDRTQGYYGAYAYRQVIVTPELLKARPIPIAA